MGSGPDSQDRSQYPDDQADDRFKRLLASALNTRPQPIKDIPKKRKGRKPTSAA